ncbi:hypothetical protein P7H55_09635 [Vagococcus lutrae]|nr:hypothetical protein [Vagococcus lutrae]
MEAILIKKALLLSTSLLFLTGCQTNDTKNVSNNTSATEISEKENLKQTKETKKEEKTIYKQDKWWEVDGQWKLKINSVTTTDERNEFSDKEPAQVVIINYTYENLGYEDEIQDLFMMPAKVIDSQNKMAETYPASGDSSPQPTPPGAIMENASDVYGLNNEGGPIKITFEQYDNDDKLQKATFEVDITE